MLFGKLVDIAATIVVVAGVTVAVSSPNTANIIASFGNAFSGSLKAAMGQYA
jgi:Na+/serine symporter